MCASILVSVIIPVWNDAQSLRRCLSLLRKQTISHSLLEIIVVDNGSTDESITVARNFEQVVVVEEPKAGSYRARNKGLGLARGEYVAFIDSDCEPEPTWIANLLAVAELDDQIGIIAGRVELVAENRARLSPASAYELLFAFDQSRNAQDGICVTANWLSPRRVMQEAGGFPTDAFSGGDTRLSARLSKQGWKVAYAADAVVRHPTRSTLATLCSKRRRLVGGIWSAAGKQASASRLAPRLARRSLGELRRLLTESDAKRYRLSVAFVISCLLAVSLGEVLRLAGGGAPVR